MPRTMIALGLLAFAGLAGINAGFAMESVDPHQRVRELIVPPPVAQPLAAQGVMGRLIEGDGSADPHARARNVIRDERGLPVSAAEGGRMVPLTTAPDPLRRVRAMILGHDD